MGLSDDTETLPTSLLDEMPGWAASHNDYGHIQVWVDVEPVIDLIDVKAPPAAREPVSQESDPVRQLSIYFNDEREWRQFIKAVGIPEVLTYQEPA